MLSLVITAALFLTAPGVDLRGIVVDAKGEPVPDAHVVLGEVGRATVFYAGPLDTYVATPGLGEAEAARWSAQLTTDRRGRFLASGLAPGEYSAVATDGKGPVGLATFRVEEGMAEVVLGLREPAVLEAEITGLDRDPGRHLLELKAVGVGSNLSIVPRIEEKGASWSFRAPDLPSVPAWRIVGTEHVRDHGFPAVLFSVPLRLAPGEVRRLEVDLARGRELAGRVTGADGAPLPGVSVVARASGGEGSERGAVTDANGRYAIRGLEDGSYVCEAARWIRRETPSCGLGFLELTAAKEIVLPLREDADADFEIERRIAQLVVGDEAPTFEAAGIDGRKVDLRALRGKVVLLDFWATWCPLCRAEIPRLVEDYKSWSKDGKLEIVGISLDEDVELVPRFAASRGIAWPQTALGPWGKNPIARLYNVHSTPTTVLVDREGKVAGVNLVGRSLRKRIEGLLAP